MSHKSLMPSLGSSGQSGNSFKRLPSMYQLTLVRLVGYPASMSQKRVTFLRSSSLIGDGGSILRVTVGGSKISCLLIVFYRYI